MAVKAVKISKKLNKVVDIIKGKDQEMKQEKPIDVFKAGKKVVNTSYIERNGYTYIQYQLEDMTLVEELIG